MTFSATVSCGTIAGSCEIAATPRSSASRGERNDTGSPASSMLPPSRETSPATILPSVDLPAPFSPTRACTDPLATVSDTPASAWTPPKCLATSRISRYGTVSSPGEGGGSTPATQP